jgi:hypothetical protein
VFVSNTDNTFIDGIDHHVMSMVNLHVPDSASTYYDDLGDHQVKAISTASVGLLDSDEAWATLFHEKRTNVNGTFAPTFVNDYFAVILSSAPPPLSTPIRCLSLGSASVALQLATPNPTSTLPHRPRRWLNPLLLLLNPLSLPTRRPGRHPLVPSVPPVAHVFPWLSNHHRLLQSIRLLQPPSSTTRINMSLGKSTT